MSRYYSYINSAQKIIQAYTGKEPFASFLKKFFSVNKKYGARDRRQISHLCYCYFRLGRMKNQLSVEEKILLGLFFCSDEPNEILGQLKPELNSRISISMDKKFYWPGEEYSLKDIFP